MNKFIYIALAVVILGAAAFLIFMQGDESQPTSSSQSEQASQSVAEQEENANESESTEQTQGGGEYIDYSEQAIADNAGKTKVIFFHADWCPNCRSLEKNILAGSIPDDLVILKANYDTETALKQKHGVTTQTTMVQIDDDGNKVKLWVASAFDDVEAIREETI